MDQDQEIIKQVVEFNLLKRNPRVDTAAYLILSYSYLARGKFEKALDIVNKVKFHYAKNFAGNQMIYLCCPF